MAAVAGVTLKTVFFDDLTESLGLLFYLGLGWVGAASGLELGRRQERTQKGYIGGHAKNRVVRQRALHTGNGFRAGFGVRDHFGNQRVVKASDVAARCDARIDPHARRSRFGHKQHTPG